MVRKTGEVDGISIPAIVVTSSVIDLRHFVRVDGRYQTTENPVLVPGPDSNRHGVSSEGFSYPLQLSLLGALSVFARPIWSLDFLFAVRPPIDHG